MRCARLRECTVEIECDPISVENVSILDIDGILILIHILLFYDVVGEGAIFGGEQVADREVWNQIKQWTYSPIGLSCGRFPRDYLFEIMGFLYLELPSKPSS